MPRDPQRVGRTAALTIVNAMLFQQVLSGYDRRVPALLSVVRGDNVAERLARVWQMILRDIDYIPIFRLAHDLVVQLTGTPGIDGALQGLARAAQRITARRAALRHDLMGRIYHLLLTDAKFFGAFYTTVPAATILLKLALDPSVVRIEWGDLAAIRQLRIADLASGTGTLLKAALHTMAHNHVRAAAERGEVPRLADVHRVLVEEVLWGLDVVPFAIHLAATALALHEPEVRFENMNLRTLPLGAPIGRRRRGGAAARARRRGRVRLGSIELFHDRRISIQADLFGATEAPTRPAAEGDAAAEVEVPMLDLCVMNPPFTRSVGGNLLFGNKPAAERAVMQQDLRELVAGYNIQASITAGLGSVFTALGHQLLKPGGQLALVLPRAVLSGIAWAETRELLARDYHVRVIVVSHEPGGWNFSENTDLSECLLVARRLAQGEEPGPTKIVNLWRRPRNSIEALAVTQQITNVPGASLAGPGTDELMLGREKIAEVVVLEPERVRAWRFNEGCAFAQTDLSRIARALSEGRLHLPGRGHVGDVPVCTLGDIAEVGPDRRDIYDGFQLSEGRTAYAAFWGYDAESVTTIAQESNRYLAALARARAGRPLRDATLLWSRAGRLFVAERLWLITLRPVCIVLPRPALSNTWWPISMRQGRAGQQREDERILALWLNATLGLLTVIAARVDTRGPWIQMKKPLLTGLKVLDPARLTDRQRARLVQLYEEVATLELRRLPAIAEDPARARIDAGILEALGIAGDLATVRNLFGHEPLLRTVPAAEQPELPAEPEPRRPLARVPGQRRIPAAQRGAVRRRRVGA